MNNTRRHTKSEEVRGYNGVEAVSWGVLWFVVLARYYCSDQIKKIEMGGTGGKYGEEERWIQGFGVEAWRKETGDIAGVYGNINYGQFSRNRKGPWTGMPLQRVGASGTVFWIPQWTVGFHKVLGISWLAEELLASQELSSEEVANTPRPWFTPFCFNSHPPCPFTPLLNLRSLIFGLTPFDLLRSVMTIPYFL